MGRTSTSFQHPIRLACPTASTMSDSLPTASVGSTIPSANVVRTWNPNELTAHLKLAVFARHPSMQADFEELQLAGEEFLLCTEKDFKDLGFSFGPRRALTVAISKILHASARSTCHAPVQKYYLTVQQGALIKPRLSPICLPPKKGRWILILLSRVRVTHLSKSAT